MFSNYFKIAWRNLFTNKLHSLINISGLALGMAAAVLLLLNIQYGLSVDQFHEKKAQIYEAYSKGMANGEISVGSNTSGLLGPALKNYPEMASVARVTESAMLFRYADKKITANGNFTDPAFLSMFSFPLVKGSMGTALKDPNDIVVTQRLAGKLFGNEDPIGKIITTPTGDGFTVTGVLKDPPPNTQFNFEYLLPYSYLHNPGAWNSWNVNTFVELAPGANVDVINQKIAGIMARNSHSPDRSFTKQIIFLYPLTKVYLESKFENGRPAGGNIDHLKMLGGLAVIILLIACINFMNLSTARSEKRGKEVGIRKVVGAARRSLIFQFIGESIFIAFVAGMIALILVQLTMPWFNTLTGVQLTMPRNSPMFWLGAAGFILLTGVMAGSYPAFYLSSFKPVRVLKGVLKNGNALVTPRKILVVVQFVFSIFLINLTVVYQKQIRYELDREVGFSKDDLVFHPMTTDLRRNYAAIKNELIGSGMAVSVCEASTTVTRNIGQESGLKWAGMDPHINPWFVLIMENGGFIQTNGLSLVAGRDIDIEKYPGDTLSCVINETSAKLLGFKNPLGQIIRDVEERWKIVGVVHDFLIGDPDQASEPLLIKGAANARYISIRLSPNRPFIQNAREAEAILKKYNPEYITDLQFADKDYATKFEQIRNTAMLVNTFTFIAIFVSCMGLLGLATLMAENRTREIGVRKVLGSGIPAIVSLLVRDFVRLILIAIVIASPLAWLFMQSFLQHFTYRTPLNAWVLAISGAAALFLALATIGFQTIRAAMANPVKSLRAE
ncbi:MAG TPA: ABC transporter permease [Puia sp.]|nr:ABC transporter permease [Puia sp.]